MNVQPTDRPAPNPESARTDDRLPDRGGALAPFAGSDAMLAAHAESRADVAAFAAGVADATSRDLCFQSEGGRAGFDALMREFRAHVPRGDWGVYQSLLDNPTTRLAAPREMRTAIAAAKIRGTPIR